MIFVSCPPKTPNAVYGGLMSARVKASRAVGSVIDGRFRDLQEQRDLKYPVRLPATSPDERVTDFLQAKRYYIYLHGMSVPHLQLSCSKLSQSMCP